MIVLSKSWASVHKQWCSTSTIRVRTSHVELYWNKQLTVFKCSSAFTFKVWQMLHRLRRAGNPGSDGNCRNCNHSIKLNSSPAISTDRSSLRCLARMALNLVSELLEKQMLYLTLFIWNEAKRQKMSSEIL